MSEVKVYGESANKNFKAEGKIGVPHTYMVGSRLIGHTSDNFSGRWDKPAILSAENEGIHCCHPGCQLDYAGHQQAVLVKCVKDPNELKEYKEEFTNFLKSIIPEIEKDDCVGFVLVDMFSNKY